MTLLQILLKAFDAAPSPQPAVLGLALAKLLQYPSIAFLLQKFLDSHNS